MHPETRKQIELIRDTLMQVSNEIGRLDDAWTEAQQERLDEATGFIEDARQALRRAAVQM